MNWKEKLRIWMTGRYGIDELSRCIIAISLLCMLVSLAARNQIIYALAIAFLVLSYIRAFSKNYAKRYKENQLYLKYTYPIRDRCRRWKHEILMRKDYHIYRCPSCKQKIRIPRGKGRIIVTCPKCKTQFEKIS